MQISVQVEKPTTVTRKLTITIGGESIRNLYGAKLAEVQKRAKLKGFREGKVPLTMVKQYYSSDVRQAVFSSLIDQSLNQAFRDNQIRAVSQPVVENAPDQGPIADLESAKEWKFVATVEVLPEVEIKDYKGLSLKRDKVEVKDDEVVGVLKNIQNSFAELHSVDRAAKNGDFVDFEFEGELKTETGTLKPKNLSGKRFSEVGAGELLEDFDKALAGSKAGDEKSFTLQYPTDYPEKDLAGKEASFRLKVNEVKEKKLPEVTDDLAKQAGYENAEDMRKRAYEFLLKSKTEEADRKVRSDCLQSLIDKNPVEVPASLVQSQMREVANEFAMQLEREGFTRKMIEDALTTQQEVIKSRAENQVKSGILLHSVARKEKLALTEERYDQELKRLASSMQRDEAGIREFFDKNPDRRDNFRFRILEEMSLDLVLQNAKIKEA